MGEKLGRKGVVTYGEKLGRMRVVTCGGGRMGSCVASVSLLFV